jgi:hypothetical protein
LHVNLIALTTFNSFNVHGGHQQSDQNGAFPICPIRSRDVVQLAHVSTLSYQPNGLYGVSGHSVPNYVAVEKLCDLVLVLEMDFVLVWSMILNVNKLNPNNAICNHVRLGRYGQTGVHAVRHADRECRNDSEVVPILMDLMFLHLEFPVDVGVTIAPSNRVNCDHVQTGVTGDSGVNAHQPVVLDNANENANVTLPINVPDRTWKCHNVDRLVGLHGINGHHALNHVMVVNGHEHELVYTKRKQA